MARSYTINCYCDLVADPQECINAGYCLMELSEKETKEQVREETRQTTKES